MITSMGRTLRYRMLKLAGYLEPGESYRTSQNQKIHAEFKDILEVLQEIAERKVDGYGPFRYDEIENNWRWEIQSLYQDIERKFGRLKTMVRPDPGDPQQADALLEILGDLAIYSARGIQIISRLELFMAQTGGLKTGGKIEHTDHRSE